jgi:predicted permease
MSLFVDDARYTLRSWHARPAFAAVAVLTLAIGVGVTTTAFSLVEGLLLRPLPAVDDAARVLLTKGNPLSYATFRTFAERQRAFAGVAAWQEWSLNLVADGEAQQIQAVVVTAGYFDVLGLSTQRGRPLLPADEGHPEQPSAVITAAFWRARFAADEGVIGRTVAVNRVPVTIVGVAEDGFDGTDLGYRVDAIVPVTAIGLFSTSSSLNERFSRPEGHWLRAIGRLRAGIAVPAAQADANRVAESIARELPGFRLTTMPLVRLDDSAFPGGSRETAARALVTLFVVSAVVLLIACANVANLLLASGERRRSEFGIRLALGGSPRRLFRQLLTESLFLVAVATPMALLASRWATGLLSTVRFTAYVPVALTGRLDARVLLVAAGLAVLTTLVCGLAPALQGARTDLVSMLTRASARGGGPDRSVVRDGLVVLQVSASVVLVTAALLFGTALGHQQALAPGFDVDDVAFLRLNAVAAGYSRDGAIDFYRRVAERLQALPQVTSVGRAINEPLGPVAFVRDVTRPGDASPVRAEATVVTPGYFRTLGIPLVEGRDFDEHSPAGAVIVNETLARRLWPGRSAVGQPLEARDQGRAFSRVIGVARDSKYESLQDAGIPFVYAHLADDFDPSQVFFVRTTGEPRLRLAEMRQAVRSLDPNVPVLDLTTMAAHVASSLSQTRVTATVVTALALLAAVLAAVGLFGVLSFVVAGRAREIAIRLALGATAIQVLARVLGRVALTVVAGVVAGSGAAMVLGRFATALLYDVSPGDPRALGAAAAVALGAGALTAIVPALRALRVDPAALLRE